MKFPEAHQIYGAKAIKETESALLIQTTRVENIWIPKSQIDERSEVCSEGDSGLLIISEWFARKEGLI